MVAPTVKEPTDSDAGDSTKWGAPDAVHVAKILKGTHATEEIQATAIADGTVSNAEYQYLNGVTSAIQTQMDLKAPLTSANLVTPALGTPTAGVLTSCTGLPLTTGVTGTLPVANGGTGVTTKTGTGNVVLSTSPTLVTPILGTPTSGTLTNCTGLPFSSVVITGVADGTKFVRDDGSFQSIPGGGDALVANPLSQFAATTSLQLKNTISDETGSGALAFATSPTLVTPVLGTPSSGTLTSCTGLPIVAGTTGTLSVARGGTGTTTSTGTGSTVLSSSPTLVTPALGTPASGVATNITGLPLTTGVTGTLPIANGGTNLTSLGSALQILRVNAGATALEYATASGGGDAQTADPLSQFAATTSLQLKGVISDETGSGSLVFGTSPTLVTPALGTPASGVATNITGLPLTTGVTGTLPVANGGTGVTSSTGTGSTVLSTSPTLVTPVLGTPTSGTLTNCTGLPIVAGTTGTLTTARGGTGLTSIGTALQVLRVNAGATALEYAAASGGSFTLPYYIPCHLTVAEDTVAYPDIHDLVTGSVHVSAAVFPDGASTSTYNIKPLLPLPEDLNGTPDLKLNLVFFPADTEATNVNTRFTAASLWHATGENLDQALTSETEVTIAMPTTIENTVITSISLSTPTVAANDIGLIKLTRDPVDAADVYADDVKLLLAYITCDRTVNS